MNLTKKVHTENIPDIVWLNKEYDGLPAGSGISVLSKTKTTYKGIWTSMCGSFEVEIPIKLCRTKL